MVRGAATHLFLRGQEYERYYPLVLGVFQNNGFLVEDSARVEDRSILKGIPRSGSGFGVEVEMRRRPKGVDVHVLVVPLQDLPQEPGRFLSREGVFGTLRPDPGSRLLLHQLLRSLKREDEGPRRDPQFDRRPHQVPSWILFDLKGGAVFGILGTAVGTAAASYLLFWAPDGPYRSNEALLGIVLFVLTPWFSGIWARSGARGAAGGFLTVLLPLLFYAISALGYGLGGLVRPPGLPTVDSLMDVFGAAAVIVPAALGLLGAIPGAIAGAVGGKIFPLREAAPETTP